MLDKLFSFSRLLNAFARIERISPMPGADRYENDMEHSYHLALMAWYLIDSRKLDLDLTRVLKYALAHDLVEVHAGDTYLWSKDETLHATKKEREEAAAARLREEYPEFPDMHEAISAYEHRGDRESRFVYALDKILPMILIHEDDGRMWREWEVTLDMLIDKKATKVALSPEVEPYFNELIVLIRESRTTAEFHEAQAA